MFITPYGSVAMKRRSPINSSDLLCSTRRCASETQCSITVARLELSGEANLNVLLNLVRTQIQAGSKGSEAVVGLLKRSARLEQKDSAAGIRLFLTRCISTLKRQNKWRSFSRIGKGILTLSSSLQLRFRGEMLLRSLVDVLSEVMLSLSVLHQFWVKGVDLAYRLSEAAYSWGNKDALEWRRDDNYAIYLGMNRSNGSLFTS